MTTPPDANPGSPGDDARQARRSLFKRRMHDRRADIERQVQATKAQLDATNERIQQRTGRNLVFAVFIGLVLGGLLLLSLVFIKELFIVFAAALAGFTGFEFATALRIAGLRVPRVALTVVSVALVPAAYYLHASGEWLIAIVGILFLWVWRLVEGIPRSRPKAGAGLTKDLIASSLAILYVPFLASFSVLLVAEPEGQWWTLATLILVVAVDTGAYAAGLSFGKHPMAPTISPKKTWEGFAGAAVMALVAGVVLSVFMLHAPWWFGLILGGLLLLTATLGDLTESLIKRDIGIKDMSSWLPGHGGFLDRLDSVLPSVALAYALYVIFEPIFR
ncbi:phosphatidate cytidylyltransferase [Humibacter sp. RRB41]|uniref:phosphatidate cytidylyltransferase n=1 Tax=Humibacter sp. RRB41 TaxID=2919946 RepID=UPI001FAAD0C8|nr:phosphatidate cytidylyltransferase [Humibacter sp. RRB41]